MDPLDSLLFWLGCYIVTGSLFSMALWVFNICGFRDIGVESGESEDFLMCLLINAVIIAIWPLVLGSVAASLREE